MSHARQVLREYVVAQITGPLGIPVYVGKVWLEDTTDLPAANILTPSESRDSEFTRGNLPAPASYPEAYDLSLQVEIRSIASVGILDVLDGYAATVQAALSDDLTWGGLCKLVRLGGTDVELSAELQAPTGVLVMDWECKYLVDMRAPAAPM